MSTVVNWATRFDEMVDFVGLSEQDRQLIKDSAPIVMGHARPLNDLIYDHILKYPEARKFFVTEADEPDGPRIEANIQTMISWLRATSSAPSNEGFARYLAAISQMHKNIPIHRPHLTPVPPRYIIGIMSYYQTAIAELVHQSIADHKLASQTCIAWNKMLMAELDLLLANYLSDD